MKREVLTYPLSEQQLRAELQHFIEFFSANGLAECRVLFGWAWGFKYYPGKEWVEEDVSLSSLIGRVGKVEATGFGKLGSDDLFLTISGLEFLFCHESDIHISFGEHQPDIEHFFQRWKDLGFRPAEWLKNERYGPGQKVRDA